MIESGVGLTTTISLAVAKLVSLTKCHFLSLLFRGSCREIVGVLRSEDVQRARGSEPCIKKRLDAGSERAASDHEA
jgi:hypothetical protein